MFCDMEFWQSFFTLSSSSKYFCKERAHTKLITQKFLHNVDTIFLSKNIKTRLIIFISYRIKELMEQLFGIAFYKSLD